MNHDLIWQKSRQCADGACVEVAISENAIYVRNSARPDQVARFTSAEWRIFLTGVSEGQFQV